MRHCWMQITAGQGPDECKLAVSYLAGYIVKEAKQRGLKPEVIEAIAGNRSTTWASALISVQGEKLEAFIAGWEGVVQWICERPFRPGHNRKNWFVGVNVLAPPSLSEPSLHERDVDFQTLRTSGPGGQHVNTTDSAVRATHKPTGITVVAREERSQHMNNKLALARLALQIHQKNQKAMASSTQERWAKHNQLERGNPVSMVIENSRLLVTENSPPWVKNYL